MEKVVIELLSHQFERGKLTRRQLVQNLTLGVVAASAAVPTLAAGTKTLAAGTKDLAADQERGLQGLGGQSHFVRRSGLQADASFYADLFGMPVSEDNGKQCYLTFGETVLIARKTHQPNNQPFVDHIAYTIDDWDHKRVEAELKRRGLDPQPDEDSFHFKDPDGYDVQIAGKDFMKTP